MDNTTIQEFFEAVKNEVIEQVRKDLSVIKSDLIVEVVAKTTEILNMQYAPIVSELEKKISKLETEICYIEKENQN